MDLIGLRADMALQETRILLLVVAVANSKGHAKKLDGLTKLAKLDFLVRYPWFAPRVLSGLSATDPRLHLPDESDPSEPLDSPMIRYKFGPWDDRYYAIIGALVGRGLLQYRASRRGNVALAPSALGKRTATDLGNTSAWASVADRCGLIAEASAGMTGNELKELVYANLSEEMNRPLRGTIS
jgi:hypothetical protein